MSLHLGNHFLGQKLLIIRSIRKQIGKLQKFSAMLIHSIIMVLGKAVSLLLQSTQSQDIIFLGIQNHLRGNGQILIFTALDFLLKRGNQFVGFLLYIKINSLSGISLFRFLGSNTSGFLTLRSVCLSAILNPAFFASLFQLRHYHLCLMISVLEGIFPESNQLKIRADSRYALQSIGSFLR